VERIFNIVIVFISWASSYFGGVDMEIKAKDVMTKDIVRVEAGEHVSRAAKILAEKKIHNVAVFENGEYAGLFCTQEILKALR